MTSNSNIPDFELACVIVNFGLGSKILRAAKKAGISGGTVLIGRGTVKNRLLELLSLTDVKKEIVLMVSSKEVVEHVLEEISEKFHFEKPNSGIAYTTSVLQVIGARSCKSEQVNEERGADNSMYEAITVIVERGNAELVIDAATEAGSKGGTIINGRGSGIHERSKLFSMEIEPEKEIVLILSHKDSTENIVSAIREKIKIDEPGNGIIFIQDVSKTYGLYK
ncbi:nitrogen regulatory protein P-II [Ureibacillus massiliensis 4400831 = CIP 108448 = CCUG 49529]|uniref:Nitrogen regulatory protein P-II n=1 Tax=Ureibacillus massiliensis 4400831 = CIP 108448 = CCUG 49529 TaxID=1211035 RepID=A0A0A3J4D2_9BACL|nr:P-II family nitrogen regulator [Ureibacillus massiliensis]KGR91874.1 nitrogen regulatory protein P-II [Ureibacillus massiliensis 4400831 = CIP 108448 = CCUG 49529]BDH63783.1 nitrogen regulatory protein P-II [Lysinibacillus sp. PLM2]